MNEVIKNHINTYNDPLKIFLEISLNQIEFFKGLSRFIKNEWIFNMKQTTLETGAFLYQIDTCSE